MLTSTIIELLTHGSYYTWVQFFSPSYIPRIVVGAFKFEPYLDSRNNYHKFLSRDLINIDLKSIKID